MSHPAYKPPPALYTKAKVAKGGAYLRDTTVIIDFSDTQPTACKFTISFVKINFAALLSILSIILSIPCSL